MADEPVRTEVLTSDGWLAFQDYFVRLRQEPEVLDLRFVGADEASATPEVLAALAEAELIVIGPSNPFVSIRPILSVPGIEAELQTARSRGVPVLAVSGILGGKAVKGPADRMLRSLGHEVSAVGAARQYTGLADVFVLDRVDANLAPEVEALGMRAVVLDTLMTDDAARERLARDLLEAAAAERVAAEARVARGEALP
jgi:LPPG:FO 2-phospho-L-lactate transferase